jgi:hypothetical protein
MDEIGIDPLDDAWQALRLIRMATEQTYLPGVLPSEEAVFVLYRPEPIHEGEALATAVIESVERLMKQALPGHALAFRRRGLLGRSRFCRKP